jgi:four helix bundle protein
VFISHQSSVFSSQSSSASELDYQYQLAHDPNLLDEEEYQEMENPAFELKSMPSALRLRLKTDD